MAEREMVTLPGLSPPSDCEPRILPRNPRLARASFFLQIG
jgi:hypothetical protein